ncbi:hypothetical protein [Streptomyces sp. NPDC057293]|uniref:hypothetical protein n=1 Tax=unclassified Streptomyces TaxID=2593676 RepID=UPI003637BBBA
MTRLELLDTIIDAYVYADAAVGIYGPGLAAAVGLAIAWRILHRGAGYIRYRRSLPERRAALAAERQHTAQQWRQRARETTPRITDRPGTNQDALDTCNSIWNASTREETP